MNSALKLRGEDHVHENDRQQKRPDEFRESSLEFPALAGNGGRVSRRQIHGGGCAAQGFNAIRQGIPRRDGGTHGHLPFSIESIKNGKCPCVPPSRRGMPWRIALKPCAAQPPP